ncbi:SGNH/GDSL hydrolase family protein [Leifsonia sp. Leaf264]|uniref:SGNH/GDSL hydrolase family protein n=1 Tax=Leifsonia sp. Leaf264 TaxID=1736314 RepID=UPI0006F9EAB3|nr:SGNH/GDSL hydrolase family protein [Leifsonia sp. Leaf264]KQO97541.1 hypothetical protein ASF30_14035 [Leifsonia sp. Leaf264]
MPLPFDHQRARIAARIGLAALAIVAVGVGGLAMASVTRAPASDAATTFPTIVPEPGEKVATFIGDEYSTAGSAADGVDPWTSALSAANDWNEDNLSIAGTGYLARPDAASCPNGYCPNLLEQVPEVIASGASVVVVAAGDNDASEDPQAVAAQILAVYRALAVGLPTAQIVAVGPSSTDSTTPARVLAIDGAIRAAAKDTGADYVSLLSPPVFSEDMVSDSGELNAAGAAAIQARVQAAL